MTAPNAVFDLEALGAEMIGASRTALAGRAPAFQAMVELELRRLAGALAETGSLLARGEIDRPRARKLIGIHQRSFRSILLSVEGLTLLAADQVMAAVTGVAGAVLNRVIGFKLITDVPNSSTPQFKAGKDL
jgi:hypothetical protein